jgi:MOSC domain-containing protein YiiM
MKIVSVNVSVVKAIEHDGKTVNTGFFKMPVNERVEVSQTNLDGDQQADLKNHGGVDKAVYGFAADHYDYWKAELGMSSMPPGQFGENLTIDGLLETRCMIGDRYAIGELVVEVSQPRVPCFKLGIRFNDKSMPKRFLSNGQTGVYFRVIETGSVALGDSLKLTHRESDSISVHELFNAFYNDADTLEARVVLDKALLLPSLAQEWRTKIERKMQSEI